MSKARRLPPSIGSAIPGHNSTYDISGFDTVYTAADLDGATWAYTSFTGSSQTAVEPGGSVTRPIQYCMAEPIEEYCNAHYRNLLFATHRLKAGGFGPTGSSFFSGIPFQQALLQVNSAQIPLSLLYVSSNAILTDMVSN